LEFLSKEESSKNSHEFSKISFSVVRENTSEQDRKEKNAYRKQNPNQAG